MAVKSKTYILQSLYLYVILYDKVDINVGLKILFYMNIWYNLEPSLEISKMTSDIIMTS